MADMGPMMDLELEGEMPMGEAGGEDVSADMLGELDPLFASDMSEAFPDLDDAQLTAIQRAVQGLIGR